MMHEILVARDYSPLPMGRNAAHGPFNGQRFREENHLVERLLAGEDVKVDLTGVRGKSSSFLDEAFGRLVELGPTVDQLKAHLKLVADDDDTVVPRIWSFVEERALRNALAN